MYSVGQIISTYRKKEKLTQPQLAKKLADDKIHLSYKTISTWEKNISEPNVTTFLHVCRLLNVPDVIEEYFGENQSNPLSQLNEFGKEKVMDYISLLISSGDTYIMKNNIIQYTSRVRTLRLYSNMVSAGTGNFLDSDDYTEIEVGDEIPQSADFGIRISGDSMEPLFINHQTVWIHQQSSLQNGEIGVFDLNGDAFCKKLQDDKNGLFLLSLNKKYPPKPVGENDSLHIFGKVVG